MQQQWQHRIIENKSDLKEWLRYERKKYATITPFYRISPMTEADAIWRYQRRLRITEYHQNTGHKIRYYINRILLYRLQLKYGMKVRPNSCGKGLKIMHAGSVMTNGDLGENCSIHVNVSIVSGGRDQGRPVIGDNVIIGVGAAVVGGVRLGNGIAVGANAVVTKSFTEDNIAIAGVPAKKISNNGRDTWNKGFMRQLVCEVEASQENG